MKRKPVADPVLAGETVDRARDVPRNRLSSTTTVCPSRRQRYVA